MLWFTGFLNYADRQAIFSVFPLLESVFPLLEKELGLDSVQLGLLGSSFALVYGVCAPFAGNIVDRVRRKSAVLDGLFGWSVICSATAFSRNFVQLLVFRAAEGLGETFYFPAAMSMISDYHGRRTRSHAMGTHQTSVYAGTIAGGFLGGLIAQHYGWRFSFVVFGGLGIVLGFALMKFLVEPARGAADLQDFGAPVHDIKDKMPIREFLKVIWTTPTVLLLMIAFMLDNFVGMVLLTWMPKFLYDKFHLSLAVAGLTATIFIRVASMAGSPIGGWLADVLRRRFAGGPHCRADDRPARRRAVCDLVWTDALGPITDDRLDAVGIFQGPLRRKHFRRDAGCRSIEGSRNRGRIHEYDGLAGGRRQRSSIDRVHRRAIEP